MWVFGSASTGGNIWADVTALSKCSRPLIRACINAGPSDANSYSYTISDLGTIVSTIPCSR